MFHFDRDFQDRNGERYMFPIRIRSLLKQIDRHFVTKAEIGTGDFEYLPGDRMYPELPEEGWRPFSAGNELWGSPDEFGWFRQKVRIPEDMAGRDVWLEVYPYPQRDVWPWGQPQIQLFVDGACVCGLDNNHRRHLLAGNAEAGRTYDVVMKVYSDLTYYAGKLTMAASLRVVRPAVYELYRDIEVPLQAAALMDTDSQDRILIVRCLNEAMNLLDLTLDPDSPEFAASVEETAAYLRENLYGRRRTGCEPVLWAVGHTHIDVAWQWTYHITRNKAARSFATALRLMDRNPEYRFMSSQPQLYEFVKEDEPRLYEEIRRRVAEGRWEPEGGMWIEADTNLTGGESLVRQFLFGKRFFREEFGRDNEVLWLPDVFGYSANLPQICRRSGIRYFYTTKIGWNEYDKFPYDTFRWRGLDGTAMLSHFGCAIAYEKPEKDWMTTYNATMEPKFVMGAWNRYQQKDINRDLLYDYGFGDGGGGPTQEMIDDARRFERGVPGCPSVKFAGVSEYFRQLEKDVAGQRHLPEWNGEMYLEFHRGTYTSQAATKKNNRRSEKLYHDAENLAAWEILLGGDPSRYPADRLNGNRKLILLNQFHDVLPGSSIHAVYEDAARHYAKVIAEGEAERDGSAARIAARIAADRRSLAVFNTLSFDRTTPVFTDLEVSGLTAPDGTAVPCQRTWDGRTVFLAPDLPAKGWRTFAADGAGNGGEVPVSATERRLETDLLAASFDEHMHLTSLFSKVTGRETLLPGETGGRLLAFEDVAMKDDAWNIQAYYREKCEVIDVVASVRVIERGPVRAVIRVERTFRRSTIREDIIAYAGLPYLIYEYALDWHEHNVLLKTEMPADVNAKFAAYEIQFGHVERPVHTNTLWDFARFEHCGHKWADLSDGGLGISALTDCKYGYDADRNHLRVSLLKCSTYPDPQQDQGEHRFSVAWYPHRGLEDRGSVRECGYDFNFVPACVPLDPHPSGDLPSERSLLRVGAADVVLETVKKAEEGSGVILRLYEAENRSADTEVSVPAGWTRACECDLTENREQALAVSGGKIRLHFRPFEVKTVLLEK